MTKLQFLALRPGMMILDGDQKFTITSFPDGFKVETTNGPIVYNEDYKYVSNAHEILKEAADHLKTIYSEDDPRYKKNIREFKLWLCYARPNENYNFLPENHLNDAPILYMEVARDPGYPLPAEEKEFDRRQCIYSNSSYDSSDPKIQKIEHLDDDSIDIEY